MVKEVSGRRARRVSQNALAAGAVGILSLSAPGLAHADEPIDQQAMDLLRAALEQASGAETVQFDLQYTHRQRTLESQDRGQIDGSIALAQPNQLALLAHDQDENAIEAVIDGQKHFQAVHRLGHYTEQEAPESFQDLWTDQLNAFSTSGGLLAMALPLIDQPTGEQFHQAVQKASVVGSATINETAATRISLTLALGELEALGQASLLDELELEVDLWVSDDQQPRVLRIVSQYDELVSALTPLERVRARADMRLSNWRYDEPIDPERLVYEPAQGLTQASNHDELVNAMGQRLASAGSGPQPPDDARDAQQLIGQPAPDLNLPLLEGGSLDLQNDHAGDIVILDFWATWCGPCIRVMPVMQSVSDDYADQDVYVYAVNLREDADRVRQFLNQHDLDLAVPMDSDRTVGNAYQIRAIPQSVIIGPNGTIQAVHIGARPDLDQVLRSEIETLLEDGHL